MSKKRRSARRARRASISVGRGARQGKEVGVWSKRWRRGCSVRGGGESYTHTFIVSQFGGMWECGNAGSGKGDLPRPSSSPKLKVGGGETKVGRSRVLLLHPAFCSALQSESGAMQRLLPLLVHSRRFAAADRVRTHITHNHIHIQEDNVYQYAAAHAVERERLRDFEFWFGLIPSRGAHYRQRLDSLQRIETNVGKSPVQEEEELKVVRDAIFRTGKPARNVPVAMRYALLCAEKGYAMTALAESVYLVQRFAEPEEGKRFFYAFETRALEACRGNFVKGRSRLKGVCVRACVEAGWLVEAAQLAVLLKAKGYEVPSDVVNDLLEDLKAQGRDSLVQGVLSAIHRDKVGSFSFTGWYSADSSSTTGHLNLHEVYRAVVCCPAALSATLSTNGASATFGAGTCNISSTSLFCSLTSPRNPR